MSAGLGSQSGVLLYSTTDLMFRKTHAISPPLWHNAVATVLIPCCSRESMNPCCDPGDPDLSMTLGTPVFPGLVDFRHHMHGMLWYLRRTLKGRPASTKGTTLLVGFELLED